MSEEHFMEWPLFRELRKDPDWMGAITHNSYLSGYVSDYAANTFCGFVVTAIKSKQEVPKRYVVQ
jgi:hypothetical protein